MNRTIFRFAASALMMFGLSAAGPTESDPGPQAVTLTTLVSYLPSPSFTWTGTGGIADGGTLEFRSAQWGGVPSPAVGALRLLTRFHGGRGTLDVQINFVVTATGVPGIFHFDGPWTVTAGTGTYQELRGTGMAHITGRVDQLSDARNPEIGVFEGKVHDP